MNLYLHDGARSFRMVVNGELCGPAVQELTWAWEAARSILNGKALMVDISQVTTADDLGINLLRSMKNSGVVLTATLPPVSEDFVRSFGVPVAASPRQPACAWVSKQLVRLGVIRG
jgi:hypothetical protein